MTSVLTSEKYSLPPRRLCLETASTERAAEKYKAAAPLIGDLHVHNVLQSVEEGATVPYTPDRVPFLFFHGESARHGKVGCTAWMEVAKGDMVYKTA
jgi:hypothetical protein